MRVEILGEERRRRWGDEKKLEVVMSVGLDGATVTEVAQRHDVTRQQIYTWRRELRKKGLLLPSAGPVFLPLDMSVAQGTPDTSKDAERPSRMIELQLCRGRSLRTHPMKAAGIRLPHVVTSDMDIDEDKIDDAVLALLWLTLHNERCAWKGFDWATTDRLHKKGMISDPVNKSKSLVLTDEGLERSEKLFRSLFTRPPR